jgi:hypothetical protein
LLAILLGVRDGRRDAKAGRPPYVLSLLRDSDKRRANLGEALKSLAVPLTLGMGLSLLFQWIIRGVVHLLPAIGFGVFLIGLPYAIARALSNRVASASFRHASRAH